MLKALQHVLSYETACLGLALRALEMLLKQSKPLCDGPCDLLRVKGVNIMLLFSLCFMPSSKRSKSFGGSDLNEGGKYSEHSLGGSFRAEVKLPESSEITSQQWMPISLSLH